uniref:Uncharacterized protein n=1 Tax=Parascaris univalens TaxID=6257 RepID=A0A915A3J0_PARUN
MGGNCNDGIVMSKSVEKLPLRAFLKLVELSCMFGFLLMISGTV